MGEAKQCALHGCHARLVGNRRKFCCNKHKDQYHNFNNPRGKFAHLANNQDDIDDNIGHPFESGYFGHGQE